MTLVEDTKLIIKACRETLEQRSFLAAYHNTFELVQAVTPEQKGKAYRLRHKIYCEENGYECPAEQDSYVEQDRHDERATHYLLMHKVSRETVGTLRIILPNDEAPSDSFPAQQLCDHPLLQYDSRALALCEISRFCMASRFRKRADDGKFLASYHDPDVIEEEHEGKKVFIRRRITYPQAALLQGAFETILDARILDCVWLVEPCHLPSLNRIGFPYRILGPQAKIHGGLQPIIFNIKHVLDNMSRKNRGCWEIVSDSGRLQTKADELLRNDWQDELLNDALLDSIVERLNVQPSRAL